MLIEIPFRFLSHKGSDNEKYYTSFLHACQLVFAFSEVFPSIFGNGKRRKNKKLKKDEKK
jgi:hypothetical protein